MKSLRSCAIHCIIHWIRPSDGPNLYFFCDNAHFPIPLFSFPLNLHNSQLYLSFSLSFIFISETLITFYPHESKGWFVYLTFPGMVAASDTLSLLSPLYRGWPPIFFIIKPLSYVWPGYALQDLLLGSQSPISASCSAYVSSLIFDYWSASKMVPTAPFIPVPLPHLITWFLNAIHVDPTIALSILSNPSCMTSYPFDQAHLVNWCL